LASAATISGSGGTRGLLVSARLPLALTVAVVGVVAFSRVGPDVGIYWTIGLWFGFILQRSRFCVAGAFRDLFMARDGRLLRAVLAGLMLATVGFWLLMVRMVPDPSIGGLPPGAHVIPVGLHLVAGGLLFGIGMVVAGGCVSGTLFRIGEGYAASGVTMLGILAGLAIAAQTWNWWWQNHISAMPALWLPALVGHGGAVVLVLGALIGIYLLILWWESRGAMGMPAFPSRPAPPAITFSEKLGVFRQQALHRGWPYLVRRPGVGHSQPV
jgi:uncharacterized protein